ncbi:MAG: hypothetical protein Q7U91_13905 [Sideroxyarcus sp.]|nr:hypothetical protein [Sideroxyarcus sp.]
MPIRKIVFANARCMALSLLFALGLTGCGGSSSGNTDSPLEPPPYTAPAQPTVRTIDSVVAAAVAEPYLSGSTVMHYCDCQNGNTVQPATGCIAGNDASGDGSATNPFQNVGYPGYNQTTTYAAGDRITYNDADYESMVSGNIGKMPTSYVGTFWQYVNSAHHAVSAGTWLGSRTSGNNTVALCQGGVWNAPASSRSINLSHSTYCPLGQTCGEFREYTATWGGSSVKPTIYGYNGTSTSLFFPGNGQRIMNLSLIGSGTGSTDQEGFFIYQWVASGPNPGLHDITIWNVDMDGFDLAIHDANNEHRNITVTGNHISNSTVMAFLGGNNNLNLNYNYFHNNGSTNMFDHTVYIASHLPITGVNAIGNYMDGFATSTGATSCEGGPFVIHGEITDLVVSGNTIIEHPDTSGPGCWGLSANHGGYPVGTYIHNGLFSNNIIVNGGNQAIGVDNCPDCVIENNLIIQDSPGNGGTGIHVPSFGAHRVIGDRGIPTTCTTAAGNTCRDELTTRYIIRNNTIYFTANADNGMTGIWVDNEGTGYQIYNNTIRYAATTHGVNSVSCLRLPLALSAYSVVNNNNCSSADNTLRWEQNRRLSLADWTALAAGSNYNFDDANTSDISTADPAFTLSAYPYITWSDSALAHALFNNGTTNVFAPPSSLAGNGRSGPAQDMAGTPRPTPPAIGAFQ